LKLGSAVYALDETPALEPPPPPEAPVFTQHGTDWRTRKPLIEALTRGQINPNLSRQEVRKVIRQIARAEADIARKKLRGEKRLARKAERTLRKKIVS
jgi:hypothetical protein